MYEVSYLERSQDTRGFTVLDKPDHHFHVLMIELFSKDVCLLPSVYTMRPLIGICNIAAQCKLDSAVESTHLNLLTF